MFKKSIPQFDLAEHILINERKIASAKRQRIKRVQDSSKPLRTASQRKLILEKVFATLIGKSENDKLSA